MTFLLFFGALVGCSGDPGAHADTGLQQGPAALLRVTVHAESMVEGAPLETIQVSVRGPGPSQSAAGPNNEPHTFEDLVPGTWTVRATSTQTGCDNHCSGETTVELQSGDERDLDLPMPCAQACEACFDPNLPAPAVRGSKDDAQVRLVHLVGEAGPLDLYLNRDPSPVTSVPIQPLETSDSGNSFAGLWRPDHGYLPFPTPGGIFDYQIALEDADGTIWEGGQRFRSCEVGTLVLQGRAGSVDFPPQWRWFDDHEVQAASDQLAISVVHAWPTADQLDLWTCPAIDDDLDGAFDPCDTTASPTATDLAFGERSVLADEPAGPRVLTLARAGEPDALAHYAWDSGSVAWAYVYLGPDGAPESGPDAWWHVHQLPLVPLTP